MDNKKIASIITGAAKDKKALKPVILDMRAVCGFCDYFVIVSGTSSTHVRAIFDAMKEVMLKQGIKPLSNLRSDPESGWLVLDYSGVVAHVFNKPMRDFYALERLWSDAKKVRASAVKRVKQ